MRGWRARYEEEQIKSRQYDRNGPIKLKWQDRAGLVAELFIDERCGPLWSGPRNASNGASRTRKGVV
jgi:hypothetical protein